jgi:hypothetical protein
MIDSRDEFCPHCGTRMNWGSQNNPQSYKSGGTFKTDSTKTAANILGGFAIVVLCIINFAFCSQGIGDSSSSSSALTKSLPIVHNSEYDDSVYQVEAWFKENLKDPKSLEIISWGRVWETTMLIGDASSNLSIPVFEVTVKYRAKNSFGGYVIENKRFTLNKSGMVIQVEDY